MGVAMCSQLLVLVVSEPSAFQSAVRPQNLKRVECLPTAPRGHLRENRTEWQLVIVKSTAAPSRLSLASHSAQIQHPLPVTRHVVSMATSASKTACVIMQTRGLVATLRATTRPSVQTRRSAIHPVHTSVVSTSPSLRIKRAQIPSHITDLRLSAQLLSPRATRFITPTTASGIVAVQMQMAIPTVVIRPL